MAKRKRIPYDPPGHRKRRRRSGDAWMRADQLFLSRRMLMVKGAMVTAFTGLAAKLGVMQLVEGEDYQQRAEDNVISQEILSAARGLILDREGRTLAENRRAWEVRVVPGQLPDDEDERAYVLNTLITALQLPDVLVIDPDAVPEGSVDTVFGRVAKLLGYSDTGLPTAVDGWKAQIKNGLIKVATLSIDEAAQFRARKAELPGVNVMNDLDYLVENIWDADLEVSVKKDVPRDVAMTLDANSMYLPGVILDDSALVRTYTGGEIMSHIIGYVQGIDEITLDDIRYKDENGNRIYAANDLIGQAGLESALEEKLRGKKGIRSVEKDANGVQVRVIPYSLQEPVAGENVRLTIDLELQNAAGAVLKEQIEKAAEAKKKLNETRVADGKEPWKVPEAGSVVAINPKTGEILAMVSYPYYDNQLFVSGLSQRKWDEYTAEDGPKAFVNRATSEVYPPGSTFKSFLAASALHRGAITSNTTHTCWGGIGIPTSANLADSNKWACWVAWGNSTPHGELDVAGAIEQSCDVFFYNVAPSKTTVNDVPVFYYDLDAAPQLPFHDTSVEHVFDGEGIDPLAEDMKEKFFFGRATGIEIAEQVGLFPDRDWKIESTGEEWNVGDSINVSIGQGEVQATPLQVALNVAGIAANGTFMTPHLVHQTIAEDGTVTEVKPTEAGKLGIDQEHLDVVKEGMVRVCNSEQGTAFESAGVSKWLKTNPEGAEKITIAGKAGTAEFGAQDEDTGSRDTHAWFTAYAPADDPEIAIAVVIEAGGEGATYGPPVADALIRGYMELTGKRDRGVVLSKDKLPIT